MYLKMIKVLLYIFPSFICSLAFSQVLVIGNSSDPKSLNPYHAETFATYNVVKNMYEGLLEVSPDNQLLPAQAESWQVSADGKQFTFKLRQGLRWSNGDALTARDFVFAARYAINPANAHFRARMFETAQVVNAEEIIAGKKTVSTLEVEALDDLTLVVRLKQPTSFALRMLGRDLVPLHKPTIEKYGAQWALPGHAITNGAYLLTDWVINEYVQLELNQRYWNTQAVPIKKVKFLPLSPEAELKRYLAGEIHITNGLPVDQLVRMNRKIPDEIHTHLFFAIQTYTFNTSNKKFADKRVRQALSLVIDREKIAEKILKKTGQPAYCHCPPNGTDFQSPDLPILSMTFEQRLIEARRLYKLAGYSEQNPLSMTVLYNTSEMHKRVSLAVADMWKQHLGVKVSLNNQEFNAMVSSIHSGDFEVARLGWTLMDQEPCMMMEAFLTKHPFNNSRYTNSDYDDLYRQACSMVKGSRSKLFIQAEQLLANDVPSIPVYNPHYIRLVKPSVGGYPANHQSSNFHVKDLYFAPQPRRSHH